MNLRDRAIEELRDEMTADQDHELWMVWMKSGPQGFEAVRDRLIEERETEICQRLVYEGMETYPFEEGSRP